MFSGRVWVSERDCLRIHCPISRRGICAASSSRRAHREAL